MECRAAHPRLTKSPEEEEKAMYVFLFFIGASISIGREILCLPYAGFLINVLGFLGIGATFCKRREI